MTKAGKVRVVADDKVVKVDSLERLIDQVNQANKDIAEMEAFRNDLLEKIKKRMGDATVGTVNGVPRITWRWSEQWRWAQFREANPHLAKEFTRTVEVEELDKAALLKEHRGLLDEYRTRRMEVR